MTAPIEPERLVAYLDGELDAAEAGVVESALASDPRLAETAAALGADLATIRAAFAEPLRTEVPERLIAAVDGAFAQRRTKPGGDAGRGFLRHPALGAVAASIIAVVVGLAGANYFAERSVKREFARVEAARAADQTIIQAAIARALETQVSGSQARWRNPDSGSEGTIEPLRTFKISTGQWCREYIHSVEYRGWREGRTTLRAVACRESDGRWKTRLRLGEDS